MYELIGIVFLGAALFWLLMLTDWYFHEPAGADRTVWLLLIVLLNIVGAFAYLCLRYRFNRRKITFQSEVPAGAEKDDPGTASAGMQCMED